MLMSRLHYVFHAALLSTAGLATTSHDTSPFSAISNTLSRYALAIDLKNFNQLSEVFTQDVVANYSAPLGVLRGLSAVQVTLEASLAPVTSQHSLTTQTLELQGDTHASTIS